MNNITLEKIRNDINDKFSYESDFYVYENLYLNINLKLNGLSYHVLLELNNLLRRKYNLRFKYIFIKVNLILQYEIVNKKWLKMCEYCITKNNCDCDCEIHFNYNNEKWICKKCKCEIK